ncbi:MAG: SDR family NAD(P)-dependent oxidoreductase, partial [Polyangiaceae bacterium]
MSLYAWLAPKGPNGFGYGSTAEDVTADLSLTGRNVLVTGCNSGLGLETARVLALRGAHVFGTARTSEKASSAFSGLVGTFTSLACELSEPSSVRACVAAMKDTGALLHAVVCNAGVMAPPKLELVHGYELQFFTNHIGHFILVTGLLDVLASDARVVSLSSAGHNLAPKEGIDFDNLDGAKSYSPWTAYGRSKLANILFAKELARKFEGTSKTANAVHPGVISTNLARHSKLAAFGYALGGPIALKNVAQGAATETLVAVSPKAA